MMASDQAPEESLDSLNTLPKKFAPPDHSVPYRLPAASATSPSFGDPSVNRKIVVSVWAFAEIGVRTAKATTAKPIKLMERVIHLLFLIEPPNIVASKDSAQTEPLAALFIRPTETESALAANTAAICPLPCSPQMPRAASGKPADAQEPMGSNRSMSSKRRCHMRS